MATYHVPKSLSAYMASIMLARSIEYLQFIVGSDLVWDLLIKCTAKEENAIELNGKLNGWSLGVKLICHTLMSSANHQSSRE